MSEIKRGEKWWRYRLGFGRIQRARALVYSVMPDAVKRAQVANPELSPQDAAKLLTPGQLLEYQRDSIIGLVKIVLDSAFDWNQATMTKEDYVESVMPEDVGLEIAGAVQVALLGNEMDEAAKKN